MMELPDNVAGEIKIVLYHHFAQPSREWPRQKLAGESESR